MKKTLPSFLTDYPISAHEKKIVEHFGGYSSIAEDINACIRSIRRGRKLPATGSVIICFTNRSGSFLLSEGMAKSSNVAFGGEHFNHNFVINYCRERNISKFSDYCIALQKRVLAGKDYFCTKLGSSQLYFLAKLKVIPYLLPDPRFVLIKRRNLLGQAVSFSIAAKTGKWTSKQKGSSDDVPFDPEDIVSKLQIIVNANGLFEKFFALTGEPCAEVYYEDLTKDFDETIKRVISQLGLQLTAEPDYAAVSLKKQHSSINEEFAARIRQICSLRDSADDKA